MGNWLRKNIRGDTKAKKIHWGLCKKNGLEHTEKWYEEVPERALENEQVKVLCDTNVHCDNVIEEREPDIVLIDKKERKRIIMNIAIPADVRVGDKERDKIVKYQDLKRGTGRLWKLKIVDVVPLVTGALESVTKNLMGGLKN